MQSDEAIECPSVPLDKEWQGTLDRMNSVFILRATQKHRTDIRHADIPRIRKLSTSLHLHLSRRISLQRSSRRACYFLDVNSA
jgi:hypothetical protein